MCVDAFGTFIAHVILKSAAAVQAWMPPKFTTTRSCLSSPSTSAAAKLCLNQSRSAGAAFASVIASGLSFTFAYVPPLPVQFCMQRTTFACSSLLAAIQ